MCNLSKVQAALQEMSLHQVHPGRDGPEVGDDERREEDQVQELLQEEGRAAGPGGDGDNRYTSGVNFINILFSPFSYKSVLSSFSLLTFFINQHKIGF
jgi:hypothetical protein